MATATPDSVPTQSAPQARLLLGLWLIMVAVLIGLMVVVGGATRLTESGLSIVHWKPFAGMIPPLSDGDWLKEFAAYQSSPQYMRVNHGMSLVAFKPIFWWEWGHRELGRVLFLAFAAPLVMFMLRAQATLKPWLPRFGVIFAIGCLQPLIGWLMVRSGLQHDPHVNHYWLTLHLITALLLFSAIVWTALDVQRPHSGSIKKSSIVLLGLITLQIILGGFVAGLRAGFAFNTWPLMGDQFIPDGLWSLAPWWQNLLTNPITVQFMHRMSAYVVFIYGLVLVLNAVNSPDKATRRRGLLLGVGLAGQVMLGIITLVNGVPVWLGTAHQGGAVVVLALALVYAYDSRV